MSDILSIVSGGIHSLIPGRSITYRRGVNSVVLTAIKGRSQFDYTDDERRVLKADLIDFIVKVTDLSLGGSLVQPIEGDLITDSADPDGSVRTYEVVAHYGEPPWRYTDQYKNLYRIHTEVVSEA